MSKRRNTCILLGTLVLTMSFFACGDSGSTDTPKGTDMSVSAMEWLPNCTENREGMTAFVEEDNATYECKSGKWRQHDIYKEIDENNAPKSSSSYVRFSSSQEIGEFKFSSLGQIGESSSSINIEWGELTDSRDNQTYKTVVIGSQTWMAENLNFKTDSSFCYNDSAEYCSKYGRLYRWAAAVGKTEGDCGFEHTCSLPLGNIQGVCPNGWHLPNKTEWETLFAAVGGRSMAANVLKSTFEWSYDGNGMDAFGFSARPAGIRYADGSFYGEGFFASFWSSIESNSYYVYGWPVGSNNRDAFLTDVIDKREMFSVRCLKGEEIKSSSSEIPVSSSEVQYGMLTDSRDGQIYKTVKIGDQVWMAQNLNYEVDSSFCYKNEEINCTKYGRLYRWAAAVGRSESACGYGNGYRCYLPSGDIQGVCPSGWHLPSENEWMTLFTVVGEKTPVDEVLKSTSGWNNNGNGSDDLGFSVLPAGYRGFNGDYYKEGDYAHFWTSSEKGNDDACDISFYCLRDHTVASCGWKNAGYSVRCLKDSAE